MSVIEIKVPDIGDFEDVPVIEILVTIGDEVEAEQGLVTVESDKATMDIPSPHAGKIASIAVAIGDHVSEGALLVTLDVNETENAPQLSPAPVISPEPAQSVSPQSASALTSDNIDADFDVAIIGGGPGGYSAAFRAADLGQKVALIEKADTLGGVCLNVGCIPSKALLHVAEVSREAQALAAHGVAFGAPGFDLDKLRAFKNQTIGRLTSGLGGMAKAQKVEIKANTYQLSFQNICKLQAAHRKPQYSHTL